MQDDNETQITSNFDEIDYSDDNETVQCRLNSDRIANKVKDSEPRK